MTVAVVVVLNSYSAVNVTVHCFERKMSTSNRVIISSFLVKTNLVSDISIVTKNEISY